jgi:hypothetical protein
MNPPETAPRDGTMILADFGWPWLLPTAWNAMDGRWAVAVLQRSHDGDGEDVWFETDEGKPDQMRGWVECPKA